MGYAICTSACIGCGNIFSYNPMRVPSSSVLTGKREPICETCFDRINARRIKDGQKPFARHPDAYTACDEGELS
jgi:hypothetical protein